MPGITFEPSGDHFVAASMPPDLLPRAQRSERTDRLSDGRHVN